MIIKILKFILILEILFFLIFTFKIFSHSCDSRGMSFENSLSQQEVEIFNSRWEKYVGSNKMVNDVRTMISDVIASNTAEKRANSENIVTINGIEPYLDLIKYIDTLPKTTYTINATYNNLTGKITNLDTSPIINIIPENKEGEE